MRFFTDHDVDASVAKRLRKLGHDAWTAHDARLQVAGDDDLTVYSIDRGAVLVTHDREFSQRRRRMIIGRHIWLRCNEWDAADLLTEHLPDVLVVLERKSDLFVVMSKGGLEIQFG